MADAQLFEDTFTINDVNSEKYDRVSRLKGISTDNLVELTLDINHELFPVSVGETLSVVLATSIRLDGTKEDPKAGWRDLQKKDADQTLADLYDYVCYGKVYRVTESNEGQDVKVYLSFGGLLLVMAGPYKKLTGLKIENLYMLVKK